MMLQNILTISGADIKLFSHSKDKKLFEINKSDLPDEQYCFLPGAIYQTTAGVINYNIALTPFVKSKNQEIPVLDDTKYFVDTFKKTTLVIFSKKTNVRAYFRSTKPDKDNNFYKYEFSGIYPFDLNTFKKMQQYTVIIHNI